MQTRYSRNPTTVRAELERQIALRKEAEEQLRAARGELSQLLASISSILIGVSHEEIIIQWNTSAENTFGIAAGDVVGKNFTDCGIQWQWRQILEGIDKCRRTREVIRLDNIRFTRLDNTEGFLGIKLNPIISQDLDSERSGFLLLGADITERTILESQLAQAQKLESVGQLAAGIAHEINTPIQYVADNSHFLRDAFQDLHQLLDKHEKLLAAIKADGDTVGGVRQVEDFAKEIDLDFLKEEIPKAIEQTLDGVDRVANIVNAMREFSHPGSEKKTAIDINRAIQSTVTVSNNEWKYVAELVTDFDLALPLVPCLPREFNQAVLNMIINAAHAIGAVVGDGSNGRGTIKITTHQDGDWAEIRISDTGSGIPEKIRSRIFDPFFTTKEVGKGTGQGLAITHSVIVDKHGGRLRFETEMGKGTTFIIRLPIQSEI